MKKIAFIENGIVGVVLNTDELLHNYFLNGERVELTDGQEAVNSNWTYSNGVFTEPAPVTPDVNYLAPQD